MNGVLSNIISTNREYLWRGVLSSVILLFGVNLTHSQPFDGVQEDWFDADQQWFQLVVNRDGVYEVDVQQLINSGFPIDQVDASELQLFHRGEEIPIEIEKNEPGSNLQAGDKIRFVGYRNTSENELWAYGYEEDNQSSTWFSNYTDNTFYWVTWSSGDTGLRFEEYDEPLPGNEIEGYRDTLHLEEEETEYFLGYGPEAELPIKTEAEGFFWDEFNLRNQSRVNNQMDVDTDGMLLSDSLITIESRFAARSVGSRTVRLDVFHDRGGQFSYHPLDNTSWSGQQTRSVSGSLSPGRLVDLDELDIRFSIFNDNSNRSSTNTIFLDWVRVSYYRDFSFAEGSDQYVFSTGVDGNSTIMMNNEFDEDESLRVYNPETGLLLHGREEGSRRGFFNPEPSPEPQEYVAVRNDAYRSVSAIQHYQEPDDLFSESNSGEYLVITRHMFMDEAENYAGYRSQHNDYDSRVVNAVDIYNQFGYGAPKPIAIRRFLLYAKDNWQNPPEYVFILADASRQFRNSSIRSHEVPSFGRPASDSWFTMNYLRGDDWRMRIPVGRLTVREPSEIDDYLDKVQQYEASRPSLEQWEKRIALLSGGAVRDGQDDEQELLYNLNRGLGEIAADSDIAADTVLFRKEGEQPLDGTSREQLNSVIDDGTVLLQFFGHSSPDSWDLLTDNPDNFENQGRPSVVLSLGCYSGLFTESQERIISEDFVYAENAAVAYIGGTGQGYISSLSRYSEFFYESIFREEIHKLGDINQRTIDRILNRSSILDDRDLALTQNTMILGDPAIELTFPAQPDYTFDDDAVEVEPDPTNLADSSMQVNVNIRNLGVRTDQRVDVLLRHLNPEQQQVEYYEPLDPVARTEQVSFDLPLSESDAGEHEFEFHIDPEFLLDEFDRTNNELETRHLVFSTGVDIIDPLDEAIVTTRDPEMIVSSPTAYEGQVYEFQLDTTSTFFAPLQPTDAVQSDSLTISWSPDTELEHGNTYWWRGRVDREDADQNWRQASFFVDTTLTGNWWHQNKDVFEENETSPSINFDEVNQEFAFEPVEMEVNASTNSWQHANQTENHNYPASILVNGVEFARLNISFHVLVIDGGTGEITLDQHYDLHDGQFTNPGAHSRQAFINTINSIDQGDYVVIRVRNFRLVSPNATLMDDGVKAALRSVGGFKAGGGLEGTDPTQLQVTDGYILFGYKGAEDPDEVSEYIQRTGMAEADTVFTFNEPVGEMESPRIGPAQEWNELAVAMEHENPNSSIFIDIHGQRNLRSDPEYIRTEGGFEDSIRVNLEDISPREYPYLHMTARFADESRQSTPQLSSWKINYEPVAELALDPNQIYVQADSIEEGYSYDFGIDLRNIGITDADTTVVSFSGIFEGQVQEIARDTLTMIDAGQTRHLETSVETLGRIGEHQIQVEITEDYPDLYRYNNLYSHDFEVISDTTAPRIEVFVDNQFLPPVERPITDVEHPDLPFVSAEPVIDVYWEDPNPYIRMEDSTLFEIELFAGDDDANAEVFDASSAEVTFESAGPEKGTRNEAYAQFRPDFSEVSDSVYTMRVMARDQSQNPAESDQGYMMSFRVSNESHIDNFYPYPNPMSNFTTFAFNLQGHTPEQVEELRMRIFTPSGQPVRTFDLLNEDYKLESGQLDIGWNKLRWDGRDEDGHRLANGVYLYKVYFRADGERIPVNNEQSVERLVIIR